MIRFLKEYMHIVCKEKNIIRLQAWAEIGFDESKRLLEHMGFHKEGDPMKDFIGKDKPAQLYVRYFDWTE